jgi:uncharacterized protein involved in copper resistance
VLTTSPWLDLVVGIRLLDLDPARETWNAARDERRPVNGANFAV